MVAIHLYYSRIGVPLVGWIGMSLGGVNTSVGCWYLVQKWECWWMILSFIAEGLEWLMDNGG